MASNPDPRVEADRRLAVVIPSFRAATTLAEVMCKIGPEVASIYIVDDGCPDSSGAHARREVADDRLTVLVNSRNLGVGGAVKRGYQRALADGADIIVKLDADGQMDPSHIGRLIEPIVQGRADYSKGDRFAPIELMPPGTGDKARARMSTSRLLANRLLSLVHGFATGCWRTSDPANGYTAISAATLSRLNLDDLADCFFFETDMLFQLRRAGARIVDVPLPSLHPGTQSTLSIRRVAPRFAALLCRRTLQRLTGGPRRQSGRPNAAPPPSQSRRARV